ncbi:hypothetical protein [Actinomadura gamaensis]|uniref:Uncharacterized protein n=1 Tax=Actinomadura gamaensis TaxID=1763541 RepID=A0ABV9TRB0_9ACTN
MFGIGGFTDVGEADAVGEELAAAEEAWGEYQERRRAAELAKERAENPWGRTQLERERMMVEATREANELLNGDPPARPTPPPGPPAPPRKALSRADSEQQAEQRRREMGELMFQVLPPERKQKIIEDRQRFCRELSEFMKVLTADRKSEADDARRSRAEARISHLRTKLADPLYEAAKAYEAQLHEDDLPQPSARRKFSWRRWPRKK